MVLLMEDAKHKDLFHKDDFCLRDKESPGLVPKQCSGFLGTSGEGWLLVKKQRITSLVFQHSR